MEKNTSIAQRPYAGVHNSTGHTLGVHDCKNLKNKRNETYNTTPKEMRACLTNRWPKWFHTPLLLMLGSQDITKWLSYPNGNGFSGYAHTYELI